MCRERSNYFFLVYIYALQSIFSSFFLCTFGLRLIFFSFLLYNFTVSESSLSSSKRDGKINVPPHSTLFWWSLTEHSLYSPRVVFRWCRILQDRNFIVCHQPFARNLIVLSYFFSSLLFEKNFSKSKDGMRTWLSCMKSIIINIITHYYSLLYKSYHSYISAAL